MGDIDPNKQELVLPYPHTGSRIGQYIFLVVGFLVLLGGPVIGIYAWLQVSEDHLVSWSVFIWFGALAIALVYLFVRLMLRMIVIGRRSDAGDGWLRLSNRGFEFHRQTGSVRRYAWRDIESFMLVEVGNDEGGVNEHVGFRYSTQHQRSLRDKLRAWTVPPRSRDGIESDGVVDGYWQGPVDDAVALMNEWLARYKTNVQDC